MRSAGLFQTLFLTAAISWPSAGAGQYYKWIDEDGQTHYGDRHETVDAQQITIQTPAPKDTDNRSRQQKRERLLEVLSDEREQKNQQRAAAYRALKERRVNCDKAQKSLQNILDSRFIYERTDDPANPRILDSAERAQQTDLARAEVKRWCE